MTEIEFAQLLVDREQVRARPRMVVLEAQRGLEPILPTHGGDRSRVQPAPLNCPKGVSDCRLIVWQGEVIPLPRQTQADKWQKRPCVVKWRNFANSLMAEAAKAGPLGDCKRLDAKIWLPFPATYSKKKRAELAGCGHRQKADADNCLKGIAAAGFKRDEGIFDMRVRKFWDDGQGPRLELYVCCCEKGDCR